MRANVALHRTRGHMGHFIKIGAMDGEGRPQLSAEWKTPPCSRGGQKDSVGLISVRDFP